MARRGWWGLSERNNLSASRPLISPTCVRWGLWDVQSIGTFKFAISAATNHNAVLVQRAGLDALRQIIGFAMVGLIEKGKMMGMVMRRQG